MENSNIETFHTSTENPSPSFHPEGNQDLKTLSSRNNDERVSKISGDCPTPGKVLLKLFLHSMAMFSLPFATYHLIKNQAEKEWEIESPKSFIYGAIAAVIVIQFIIGSYVYQAFKEEKWEREMKKLS